MQQIYHILSKVVNDQENVLGTFYVQDIKKLKQMSEEGN
jgi:hypothetical protein